MVEPRVNSDLACAMVVGTESDASELAESIGSLSPADRERGRRRKVGRPHKFRQCVKIVSSPLLRCTARIPLHCRHEVILIANGSFRNHLHSFDQLSVFLNKTGLQFHRLR